MVRLLNVVGVAVVAASAAVGLWLDDARPFVAQNMASDFLIAALCLASLIARRPLVGLVALELIPGLRRRLTPNASAFVMLTAVYAAINLVTGVMRLVMLHHFDPSTYVILSRVVGLPFVLTFYGLAVAVIARHVDIRQVSIAR